VPTWMVVEDEPDIYDVLLAMFEIWGIEGVAFVDGAEAVAWIGDVDQGRVRGELPELAILDIRLPEVSGPEVGKRLRESPVLKDIAIVLITAYRLSPEEEEQVVAQAQADLLMYKPLPAMAELRTTMDAVIAKHQDTDTETEAEAEAEAETEPEEEPALIPEPPVLAENEDGREPVAEPEETPVVPVDDDEKEPDSVEVSEPQVKDS
jgi:CheY-like chemotaxis protein